MAHPLLTSALLHSRGHARQAAAASHVSPLPPSHPSLPGVEQLAPRPQGRGEGGPSPPLLLTGTAALTAAKMPPDAPLLSASWERLPLVAGWLGGDLG